MFRRSKDFPDAGRSRAAYSSQDDFFGDEDGTARGVQLDELGGRITQVEAQIASQFTSLATYSQIAQEQTELVRGEARHETDRNTARVIALVEQERADRIAASDGPELDERLELIETQIADIHTSLQQCLASQHALVETVAGLVAKPLAESPVTERPLTAPPSRAARVRLAFA